MEKSTTNPIQGSLQQQYEFGLKGEPNVYKCFITLFFVSFHITIEKLVIVAVDNKLRMGRDIHEKHLVLPI